MIVFDSNFLALQMALMRLMVLRLASDPETARGLQAALDEAKTRYCGPSRDAATSMCLFIRDLERDVAGAAADPSTTTGERG